MGYGSAPFAIAETVGKRGSFYELSVKISKG